MTLFQVLVSSGSTGIFLYSVETNHPAVDVLGASQVVQVNLCEDSGAFTRFTAVQVATIFPIPSQQFWQNIGEWKEHNK